MKCATRTALLAHGWLGARALAALDRLGTRVAALITHDDLPAENASLLERAARQGLAVYTAPPYRRWEGADVLRPLSADLLLSAGFRAPLSAAALGAAGVAALNLHPSLLPRYRGRSPVNWAILRGERETGLTLHHMVEELDAGDIICQRAVPIGSDDTATEVIRRLEGEVAGLLAGALPLVLAGGAPRTPQDAAAATYFGGRRPEDGLIDWRWPARRIHDLVRAVARPFPGAFALRNGGKVFVWRSAVHDEPACGRPGDGVRLPGGGFGVATGAGTLEVLRFSVEDGPERQGKALEEAWGTG